MPGLNDPYAEFYSGSMLAPNRVGDKLVQAPIYSGPTSISDMYKGIYADAPQKPSAFSPVGPGPDWGALTGMTVDPIYSAPAARTAETQVPGLPANGVGYGAGTTKGASMRLMPSLSYADAFGQVYGAKPASGLSAIERATSNGGGFDPVGSGPSWGGIADMFGGFLSGDPGTTDWSVANQGGAGLRGPLNAPYAGAGNPPPARPKPHQSSGGIADLYDAPTVQLASGKHAQVGATGKAQGGRYTFTVQPDGSVIDAKTGRVTAPAPTRTINKPLGPQNNSDGRWNGVLDQFGMIL